MNESGLLELIEKLRRHMTEIAEGKGLTDPEVIEASQKLDEALNQYCKLIRKNINDQ